MDDLTPESINVATWKIPSPLGIIGSHANGEFNGMTASWITQVSMDPPCTRLFLQVLMFCN